ncbi:MAG: membrane integrity-associated transporter subunit PqiC, partial [Gammaproteobacteria bacterium]|nr:membrane integrity-associated transporter subunit PqiC [Gammaproteobacteria bacterium]
CYTFCILFFGCASSPPVHFYLLDSGDHSSVESATSAEGDQMIGIGPVRFPDYLDRPQIVTRSGDNELVLSETHRWVEPLEENFSRILAVHFSRLTGSSISIEPSRNRTSLDLRIIIDVVRFDTDANGNINLVSYWQVENQDSTQRIAQRRSTIEITGYSNSNYPAIVDSMSEAVARLAGEIAGALTD